MIILLVSSPFLQGIVMQARRSTQSSKATTHMVVDTWCMCDSLNSVFSFPTTIAPYSLVHLKALYSIIEGKEVTISNTDSLHTKPPSDL